MAGDIAGIVLAAGFSSRMGAFKPLLPLGSLTVIERAIISLRNGGVGDIVIVTGHRAKDLRPYLEQIGVCEVYNPRFELGMFASVLAGVAALLPRAIAAFVLPADIPLVKPSTILQMTAEYKDVRPAVVFPTFRGKRGHPPLVSRACFDKTMAPEHEGGLAAVLAQQANIINVPVLDEGILWDIDTTEDYARMLAYVEGANAWSEREYGDV
jgi:molybdenum cofactor cytidylyltransferase